MDIHKPKPVHGWRELLGEIGVIVIGVLIALGGEQAVEAYHWHQDVAEARATLDGELQDALFSAHERLMQRDCLDKRIAWLQQVVAGKTRTPAMKVMAGARQWSTSTWQSVSASNVLAHMKSDDRLDYAQTFNQIDAIRGWNREEYDIWSDVSTLNRPSILSDIARDRLQSDLARASKLNFMMSVASKQMIDGTRLMGVTLNADNRQAIEGEKKLGCRMPDEPAAT